MERISEMSSQAAVEKAKRLGRRRKFYVSSPSGWMLVELLPKVDMISRILSDYFVDNTLTLEEYKSRKNILYEYIEGIDEWSNARMEEISKNKKDKKGLHYKGYVDKFKYIYLNTQLGLDGFHSFARCDTIHRAYMQAMRINIVTEEDYKKGSDKLFDILDNLRTDIQGLKEFTWKLKKSNSRKSKSKSQRQTKNSSQQN